MMTRLYYKLHNQLQALSRLRQFRNIYSTTNEWPSTLTLDVKKAIEKKWAGKCSQLSTGQKDAKKFYVLAQFPYPSGNLHMGHVRVYTISDALARFHRLLGKDVLHPIGWDAFGLPAENASIEKNVSPETWTNLNIERMKQQLGSLGCLFDWSREISTCSDEYYKWTQYIFLKMYSEGLVYQRKSFVNWDPIDQTVLADEQVDEEGMSWRSGAKVEKKAMKQWFIRTTRFAKDLLEGLSDPDLENWRDITALQKHWIGKCDGCSFNFQTEHTNDVVTVWTPHPEFIFGAAFLAVKSTHILAESNVQSVIHPFTGKHIPVLILDDFEYADGADTHLGLPGVNEVDANIASMKGITIIPVLTSENTLMNSGAFDRLTVSDAREAIPSNARERNFGGYWTSSKLRDWLVSRQRYWGTPIPIIHCDSCGAVPVPADQLPVRLPRIESVSERGKSALATATDWIQTSCPKCGTAARRETDTMDTFVDSSWYYLRYLDPSNKLVPFDPKTVATRYPIDIYVGGKEHATIHLYYARFVARFLHHIGLLESPEPFRTLLPQGMVMGQTYKSAVDKRYLHPNEISFEDKKPVEKATQKPVEVSWEKMSKSKYNGVEPETVIDEYGIDTSRLLILSTVAPTSHRNWNADAFPGILKWQNRVWMTVGEFLQTRKEAPSPPSEQDLDRHELALWDNRNFYLKGIRNCYLRTHQLSVAVSKMQGLTGALRRAPPAIVCHSKEYERALAVLIISLAPIAPHFASELWHAFKSAPGRLNEEIHWDADVLEHPFPALDRGYKLDLLCQVNGKEQCVVKLPQDEFEKMSEEIALQITLQQRAIEKKLRNRVLLRHVYELSPGYQTVVNLITNSS